MHCTSRRSFLIQSLLAAAAVGAMPFGACAEDSYPNRAIKMVVPLAAGGVADIVPRIVADKLASRWGQPVIIENRPGAGHNIGAEVVAKAEPDGYTLLATPPAPLVTTQLLNSKLPFDPTAFTPISIVTTGHLVLVVSPNVTASNLQELMAFARANPGKLTYASPGAGTSPHLTGEMLKALAGIQTTHVPYRGLGPAVTDLLAGHVDIMFDNLGNSLDYIRSGKLRAFGIASASRIPELPDVPAIAETYPGFLSTSWLALVAPPNTPAAVAAKVSQAVRETVHEPSMAARLKEQSFTPVGMSPSETRDLINREAARWREAVGSTVAKIN